MRILNCKPVWIWKPVEEFLLSPMYSINFFVSTVPSLTFDPVGIILSSIVWSITGGEILKFIPTPAVNFALASNGILNLNSFFWAVIYPDKAPVIICFFSVSTGFTNEKSDYSWDYERKRNDT